MDKQKKNSWKFCEIEEIEEIEETSDVYDIEVDDIHNFFANDILVHNCLAGLGSYSSFHPDVKSGKLDKWSVFDKELGPLMEIFGSERFYLELQFNKIPEQQIVNLDLIEYSKRTNYNLIVTADCHYPSPEMWKDREMYRALGYQMQKSKFDKSLLEKSIEELDCELYLKNGDQIFQTYKDSFYKHFKDEQLIKEAIERTHDIAHNLCEKVYPDSSYKLPKTFQVTEKIKTPFDKLKELTLQGLKQKNLSSQEYINRSTYELKIIKKLGVENYFLTKLEIINTLKKHMLIGAARGSSAGSLICYLIGITMIDPIKYGLLFERFMSISRAELPDIDSDVELKEQSLDILKEHFGEDNVLAITNYNRLQLKSLIKDLSNIYEIPFQEVNQVTKKMEIEAKNSILKEVGDDQKLYELTFARAKKYSSTFKEFLEKYPQLEEHIANLYREIKSLGKHAGGILVLDDAESCLPIIRIRGIDQSPVTEGLAAQHLQYFGLIKFDVLGLATLKIIRRCIEKILKDTKNINNPTIEDVWNFYNEKLHPSVINTKDKKVFKNVYHKGQWPSIFQFTEKGVQSFVSKAKPISIEDISAITSIYRPGALKDQGDKKYLWANEPDKIKEQKKEHPIIQKILGPTRHVLCFQEQFMLLAQELAGFTLEEANKLRKLLVKIDTSKAEEIRQERIEIGQKFITGCIEKGLTKERAEKLWNNEILGSISYSFNKAHSISYAFNSYHCAWLFTYYPHQWIKACLECDPDLEKTINVVRSIGYIVKKPNINTSLVDEWFVADDLSCAPALTSLKGIGNAAAEELVKLRPKNGFQDIHDFFFEKWEAGGESGYGWRWSKLNKKTLEALIKMEAFESLDCIGPDKLFKNYKHMYESLFNDVERISKSDKIVVKSCYDLIKTGKMTLEESAQLANTNDWSTTEKMTIQREIVGFYDKNLIVGKFIKTFDEFNIKAIDETEDEQNKNRIWGVIEKIIEKKTKTNKPYLVVSASGTTNKLYQFRIWNMSISQTNTWKEGNIVIFSLQYEEQWGYSLLKSGKVLQLTK